MLQGLLDTDIAHPPSGGTDPFFSSVSLLTGFEGANGSTTVTDEGPLAHGTANVIGNAQISTAQFVFGTSSALFDGTGDAFTYNDPAASPDEFDLGSGNFTVECRIRPVAVAGSYFIVGRWGAGGSLGWILWQSANTLTFNLSTTGSDNITHMTGGTMVVNTWYTVCADFDGTKYRLYKDGVMTASSTTLRTINTTTTKLSIGANETAASFSYNGWIDELRITKGVARYASDSGYTPATAAFPRS